jgi:hypothetical protein
MTSYEVVVVSEHDNTDTLGHRFPAREEAEMAADSLREWRPGVKAAVVERRDDPTITYEQWMERGW